MIDKASVLLSKLARLEKNLKCTLSSHIFSPVNSLFFERVILVNQYSLSCTSSVNINGPEEIELPLPMRPVFI